MNNNELKSTKKLWWNLFDFKFKKLNDDGTEWWVVYPRKGNRGTPVYCSSYIMCHKICYTAYQILNNRKITFTIATNKARLLLTTDTESYNDMIDEINKKVRYTKYLKKRRTEYKKEKKALCIDKKIGKITNTSVFNKYRCPIHGVVEINSDEDITECNRCIRKIKKCN